jgi:hypothetical protein
MAVVQQIRDIPMECPTFADKANGDKPIELRRWPPYLCTVLTLLAALSGETLAGAHIPHQ